MRFYAKDELRPLIQYRGESEHAEWALWLGDIFIIQKDGPFKMQHPEDDFGLPVFNPYKDPIYA